jgi:DNA-binding MarR family transcriptional regulator
MTMEYNSVLAQIWQLLHSILLEATPEFERHGISTREYLLLSKIEQFPYPAQLTEQLFLPPSTVTLVTKNLEKQHLITRRTDKSDLRRFRFELSANGRKVLKDAGMFVEGIVKNRMGRLSKEESRILPRLLSIIAPSPIDEIRAGGER